MAEQSPEPVFKVALIQMTRFLIQNLTDLNEICDYLYAKKVISSEEYERIVHNSMLTILSEKSRQLVTLTLPKKGPEGFRRFLEALAVTGNKYCLDELKKKCDSLNRDEWVDLCGEGIGEMTVKDVVMSSPRVIVEHRQLAPHFPVMASDDPPEPFNRNKDWLYISLNEDQRNARVNEDQIFQMSRKVLDLDKTSQALGFTPERTNQFKFYAPGSVPLQAMKMLAEWRRDNGGQATIETLVNCLRFARVNDNDCKDIFEPIPES